MGYPCTLAQPQTIVRAVARLELLEPRAVHDAREHVTGVDALSEIATHDAEQLLGVVDGIVVGSEGGGPYFRQLRWDTTSRHIRMASISSSAR